MENTNPTTRTLTKGSERLIQMAEDNKPIPKLENKFNEDDIRKAFRAGSAYAIGSHINFKESHPNENQYIKSL